MNDIENLDLLPCPFCGERLVLHDDHHGQWWAHRDEVGECIDSVVQIMDEKDAGQWNTRAPLERTTKP